MIIMLWILVQRLGFFFEDRKCLTHHLSFGIKDVEQGKANSDRKPWHIDGSGAQDHFAVGQPATSGCTSGLLQSGYLFGLENGHANSLHIWFCLRVGWDLHGSLLGPARKGK